MVSIDLTYKVWWWPWKRRLRGWAPIQWWEMSEQQYMAVVRAWMGELDIASYHSAMFGLPKRLLKQLDSWQTYMLANIKAGDRKVLFVLPENSNNIYLSSRNLPQVKVITVDEINTYAIMDAHSLVLVDGVQDILAARVK